MNFSFQYPPVFIFLCLLLGVLYAAGLYWREKHFANANKNFKKWYWLLALLRFLVVSFIAMLILSPIIKSISSRTEKPVIVVAQDNSESVEMSWNKKDSAAYRNALNDFVKKLSPDFEVRQYAFGSNLKETPDYDFKDKTTNMANAFDELSNLYSNRNLGAIVLAGDGIFNQGSSPVYSKYVTNVPVYTIALGDTTIKRDLKIARVYFNSIAYLGNNFSIRADIQATFCNNENSVFKLEKIEEGGSKILSQKNILINSNAFETSTDDIVAADKTGIQHYRLSVSSVQNEVTLLNNTQDIYIEVLDAKEKVLILANSPHPDLAAMKQAIETNKNYQADVRFASSFNGNIHDYSLLILHQLPSQAQPVTSVLQQLNVMHKPVLFVLGSQTNLQQFNNLQTLLKLNGINPGNSNDVLPVSGKDFNLFILPEDLVTLIKNLPPLQVPYASDYKFSPDANILFYQRIGNVQTNFPLVLFQQSIDSKIGVVAGEGLWRWRLYDFMLTQNHEVFDLLMTKFVQYLAVKPDQRQFRVWLEKSGTGAGTRLFDENEPVLFGAELYNDAYEKVTTPDVILKIKNSEGKEFPFTFNKVNGSYSRNAGYFPAGNYSYEASTNYNNKPYSESGNFSVAPVQLEQLDTRANHQLLFTLSEKSGGKLFYANQFDELYKTIKQQESIKPVIYQEKHSDPLINLKWIFFLLLFLLTGEWFIRKWQGAY